MHGFTRIRLLLGVITVGGTLLTLACANGAALTDFDAAEAGAAGNSSYLPPTGRDSGGPTPTPTPTPTADAAADADSGKKVDAAPPPPPPPTGAGDCVGTTSAQLATTYDEACDNYFFNSFGKSNPCTPGGNSCAAMDTPTLKFCCFKSPPGSDCAFDYNTPQCLPK